MITSAGIGSGIDIESIVTQLMEIEREPLNRLLRREQGVSSSISELGGLKGRLSELETAAEKLSAPGQALLYPIESSDEQLVEATTQAGYSGSLSGYRLEIEQLAESHQMTTDLFADGPDSAVSAGNWTFSVGAESFSVNLNGDSATLSGLRDAINAASDNTGVSATVLNLSGGSRLILSSTSSGSENTITAPALFSESRAAADALFSIDGFSASSSSNTVNNVVPGLTMELRGTGEVSLQTSRSTTGLAEVLEEFATAYNNVVSGIDSLRSGSFQGDATLAAMRAQLSSALFQQLDDENGDTRFSLLDTGLNLDRDGKLQVDTAEIDALSDLELATLQNALSSNDINLVSQFTESLDRYLDTDGFFDNREDSLERRQRQYEQQAERMEYRLEQVETRYRRQFTAMDGIVARLQNDSLYLLDQLNVGSNNSS